MSNLEQAKALLQEEGCTFAACRGESTRKSRQRGVQPLLELRDGKISLRGWAVADRVIGRAAAFLYVLLEAEQVYGEIISRPALAVFEKYHVPVTWDTLVDGVVNRAGTGMCPMESAVLDIREPGDAERAIRQKLKQLQEMKE